MADIKEKEVTVAQKSITYYNEIAPQYDAMLEKELANSIVRKTVAESFIASVKKGWVLDLGGGTGQDLRWLTTNGYQVIFCEPSAGMRKIAMQNAAAQLTNNRVTFLEGPDTDFMNWATALPFDQRTEGALLNFAVLNCISNIDVLFKQLSLVIKPGGRIVALILSTDLKTLFRKNPGTAIKKLLFNTPTTFSIQYQNSKQIVYNYTKKDIRKAAAPNFTIVHCEIKKGPGFTLLHLIKT
jgi:ubiquinone/menaquinone biosynthesis C-methylase UbiE